MFKTFSLWFLKAALIVIVYILLFPIIAELAAYSMEKLLKLFLEPNRQGTYTWIISSLLLTIIFIAFLLRFLFKYINPLFRKILKI
jgi:hypothetical protein